MRISTRITIDLITGEVLSREAYEYQGPVSQAFSGGGGTQKQRAQSTQESRGGTAFNEDFLKQVFGKSKTTGGVQTYGDDYEPGVFGYEPTAKGKFVTPAYTPAGYTGGKFTAVAPEGFQKLEENIYGGSRSKLSEAYNQAIARQREERSQAGGLNDPAQYLEGGVRAATDRSYLDNLQQAARDAFSQRLGLEEREAGRKTAFDVGEGQFRTAFDVGEAARQTGFGEREAGRETEFNVQQEDNLWKRFMSKLAVALEASKYQTGQAQSTNASDAFNMNMHFLWG